MKTLKKLIPVLLIALCTSLFTGCAQILGSLALEGTWSGPNKIMDDDVTVTLELNSDLTYVFTSYWSETSYISTKGSWQLEESDNGMLLSLTQTASKEAKTDWTTYEAVTFKYTYTLLLDTLEITRVDNSKETYTLKKVKSN